MSAAQLDAIEQRLDELRGRIERLIRDPSSIRGFFPRLAGPVFRALGWEPRVETRALSRLVELHAARDDSAEPDEASTRALRHAIEELQASVSAVERAKLVYGGVPPAQPSWLHRMLRILEHVITSERRDWSAWDRRHLLVRARDLRAPLTGKLPPDQARLAAIDPLIRAAEDEQSLARRRRLLEAARELLLDVGAALDVDGPALASRREHVTRAIIQIDRYQAAGLKPQVGLVHQLRQAIEHCDTQRAHAALSALEELSVACGDRELGDRVTRALSAIRGEDDRFRHEARADSLARSATETFDPRVHRAVKAAYERAREELPVLKKRAREGDLDESVARTAEEYLLQDGLPVTLRAALAVDGCFDVGGVLSPARVVEEERRLRLVEYPTQQLLLRTADGPGDLPNALIDDPRTVLLDLASGRLLSRRYVAEETRRRERVVLRGEVRVYLLDGSASMLGPRARMRDALLVAELSTLIARRNDPLRDTNPVLYYRYFTRRLGETQRVESEEQALAAIERALANVGVGGTDIEAALLASFEVIAGAQRLDTELARAQIVLVTDGEAPVDADKILEARSRIGELPIGVSIIALGQENPALRALAAKQRARGERVFYHYMCDAELAELLDGRALGPAIHAPPTRDIPSTLAELVDEIEAYTRGRFALGGTRAEDLEHALGELGLSLDRDFTEGERALHEARARDERTLVRRFERWFPQPSAAPGAAETRFEPPATDLADLSTLECVLASVTEVVDLIGGDALERHADAIDLFERVLLDAGVTPWRYAELCRRYPHRLRASLETLRAVVGG